MMRTRITAAVLLAASLAIYLAGQQANPPGFYLDECSIGFNALQIARHGVDEHGVAFPLFFEAFGEYKNPVYIYLLAAVFKATGPSNLVARRLSALLGWLACVAIGWLGWRVSRSRAVAAASFLLAVFTPMIFEISRLAFEVTVYPLATALFLLAVWHASRRERWTARDVAAITATLLLLTYAYSIGRLFAPLLLVALIAVFFTRARLPQLTAIAMAFVLLGIAPIVAFNSMHGGAMTLRFNSLSGIDASRPIESLTFFEQHYVDNALPLRMGLEGDPNIRHHVPGSGGSILLVTFALAAGGAVIAFRSRDRWWRFVLAGTALSLVPVSLTVDRWHTLRMAPYPVFLVVLSIPALEWLRQRRRAAMAIAMAGAIQAVWFFTIFCRDGGKRWGEFDHGGRHAVDTAIAQGIRPIAVDDSVHIQAWWYGAQRGVEPSAFAIGVLPKPGGVVISAHGAPKDAKILLDAEGYTVYIARW
jgi:4-amino-4-deoxy-L-arabinose transferase-like glycosyltransferase